MRMLRVSLICWVLIFLTAGCSKNAPESERELATRSLAQYVARSAAPKSVLVISNPFSREGSRPPEVYAFETAGIAGLKSGFGPSVSLEVDYPALKPEVLRDPNSAPIDPQTTTPLSFLVSDGAFSTLAQRHAKADLIVSLIGLPVNISAFKEWKEKGPPKFALLLPDWRMVGGSDSILEAFRSGKLVAAVITRPHAPDAAPGKGPAAFDQRFLLVTADNVQALLKEYPAAFGLR